MSDLRQACDRCHDKKLRCQRAPGAPTCGRCSKANAVCIFSPPTRALRPEPQHVPFDWSSLLQLDQSQVPDPGFAPTPAQSSSNASDGTEPGVAAQLADMTVSLDGIWNRLKSQNFHHASPEQLRHYVDKLSNELGLHLTLEQLLLHSQRLVELYADATKAAIQAIAPPESDEACVIPDCIHREHASLRDIVPRSADIALINLLLACHNRLLDVFIALAEHGKMCSNMVSACPPDYEPQFDIPQLRMGAFVAPKDAAASMLLSMLIELHERLMSKNVALSSAVSLLSVGVPKQVQMVNLLCEVLQERSTIILSEYEALKNKLLRPGLVH